MSVNVYCSDRTDVLHDVSLVYVALCVLLVCRTVYVSWQMTAVGITENVKGDVKKFEIWYSGREEVYVVQVRSLQYSTSLTSLYDSSI